MYLVTLDDGAELAVELDETNRGRWVARLDDGTEVELEVRGRGEDGEFVLVVDGHERAFRIDAEQGTYRLRENGTAAKVDVVHAADVVLERLSKATPASAASETLTSPITGIVLQVHVEPGATVRKGEPLVVVEAMKMENTLEAPCSGTVSEVLAEAGQTVFVGDPLVQIT